MKKQEKLSPHSKKIIVAFVTLCLSVFTSKFSKARTELNARFHHISNNITWTTFQQQEGTVKGTVTDSKGNPLPGVNVVLKGENIGTATDVNGRYSFNAEPGDYVLQASIVSFKTATANITITEGGSATQDFQLQQDVLNFSEVVVTGTKNPKTKIESSVAITTLQSQQLNNTPPRSSADALKAVPGFYVESSGGESGNNLFVRGIPADGSYRYVTVQENGLPVYEAPELAFANIDEFFRIDETVDRIEAVRGGSASIYASNAPGGIINLISKTGGNELDGIAKFTGGTHSYARFDFNVGGPFNDQSDWRYNVGGFYRYDEGARDAGFAGNKGGQIKANITRLFDNGYIRFYGKYLNDRNIFYLPVPLTNPDNPESIPGFNAHRATLTTDDAALVSIPGRNGDFVQRDLTDGIHPVYRSIGAQLQLDLGGGFSLQNSARAMKSSLDFNAIFSLNNPFSATNFGQRIADENGASGWQYIIDETGEIISPSQAANLNGNGQVVRTGWWYINKPLSNFSDNFELSLDTENNTLTGGLYFSSYSADEFRSFNNILTEVTGRPKLLDLQLLNADGSPSDTKVSQNGFLQYGASFLNANNDGTVAAFYLNDEWQATPKFRIDAGVRLERQVKRGQVETPDIVNIDGDPNTLYDNNVPITSGNFRNFDFDFNEWAASIGINYSFNDTFALYGRGSRGFRTQDFDVFDTSTNPGDTEIVYQVEGGAKISSPTFALNSSIFYSRFENLPFTDTVLQNGELINLNRFANSETIGLELKTIYSPVPPLQLKLTATIQDPRLRDFTFTVEENGQLAERDNSGNRVKRIPQILFEFTPQYSIGGFSISGQWRFIGERFSNNINTVKLPAFSVFNATASYKINRVKLTAGITNIAGSLGLTEGNPRVDESAPAQQRIFVARPILPRAATLSVGYNF